MGRSIPKMNANPVPGTAKSAQNPALVISASKACNSTKQKKFANAPPINSSPARRVKTAAQTAPNALQVTFALSVNLPLP